MEQVQEILNNVLGFAREGFGEVNAVMGLLIALIAAFLMSGYSRIIHMTIGATLVHIIVELLMPVVMDGKDFRLPELLSGAFWNYVGVLLIGYFIVISVFYMIRRILLRR